MNQLANETSPYLLQHAHNPVDWFPWGNEALAKAKAENKPIIVSIGYSACHWCHVMERESFENAQVAAVMNEHFVCIKVDREERPDVDAVYMDAVQAMGVRGGWPLNVFLLPDGRPFYGGTYFPAQRWVNLCYGVRDAFDNKLDEIVESADSFVTEMNRKESDKYPLGKAFNLTKEGLKEAVERMAYKFDREKGGLDRAPKFPMPSIWLFLLRFAHHYKQKNILDQTLHTLDRMAMGGIYDQLGGGFARYSTDADWLLPHFEKMMYDNGQLFSLYAEAIKFLQQTEPNGVRVKQYKTLLRQSVDWLATDMTSPEGSFYSALDADSEGEEGKFYVWLGDEISYLLADDAPAFAKIFGITAEGNYHDEATGQATGLNILHRKQLDTQANEDLVSRCFEILLAERNSRIRPGLDDKQLYSWNALMLKGLVDAHAVLKDDKTLAMAEKCAEFLSQKMSAIFENEDAIKARGLFHSYKNGRATITAYLDDYAAGIQAFTALYEANFNDRWLQEANELAAYAMANFYDPNEGFFFFTDSQADALIARKKELFDNVVPASNSMMANALYRLGLMLDKENYQTVAVSMLAKIAPLMKQQIDWLSNWGTLALDVLHPMAEVIVVGPNARQTAMKVAELYHPNKIMMATTTGSDVGLLQGRKTTDDKTKIFVCYNKTCQLPTTEVATAWEILLEP